MPIGGWMLPPAGSLNECHGPWRPFAMMMRASPSSMWSIMSAVVTAPPAPVLPALPVAPCR